MDNTSSVTDTDINKLYNSLRDQREKNNNQVVIDEDLASTAIVAMLNSYFNSKTLTVKDTTLTKLGNIVYLGGTVDAAFGKNNLAVRIRFDAEENDDRNEKDIIFELRASLPDNWKPGGSYTAIAGTIASQISLTETNVILASAEFWDDSVQKRIPAGLSFTGKYTPTDDFLPLKELLPPNASLSVSGSLASKAGVFFVRINATNTVDVTLNLIDLRPLTLTGALLYMETRYMDNVKLYKDKVRLAGTIRVNGKMLTGTIQNADTTSQWEMKIGYSADPPSTADLISLLNASSTFDSFDYFPPAIVAIADIDITDYAFTFNQLDHSRTGIRLQFGFKKLWDQLPVLDKLSNVETNLNIERYKVSDTFTQAGFNAVVKATTQINSTPVDLVFYVGPPENWSVEIKPQGSFRFPSLTDIASLIGGVDVKNQVPNNMNTLPVLTIKSLRAGFNVKTLQLNYTAIVLTIEGEEPWYIIQDKLGINAVFIDLRIDDPLTRRTVTGSFGGNIEVATGDPKTKILIPVVASKKTATQGWNLDIAKNTQVPVPDIPSLLKLVGAESQVDYLPAALKTLDNFMISNLSLSFATTGNALEKFGFFIGQKDDLVRWHIIQDQLMISKLKVNLTVDHPLDSAKRNFYGYIGGNLIIGKKQVPVLALKASPASGWNVRIASDVSVKLPSLEEIFKVFGASDYFDWFPAAIRTFPSIYFKDIDILFKPAGIDNGADKIEKLSFEVGTTSKWTLLESVKLVISEVKAGVQLDFTKNPKAFTGEIQGSVSIFKNKVDIRAERKTDANPWKLVLKAGQRIHTPNGLAALAKWMASDQMLLFIPEHLIPFKDGFDITDLNLNFNLSESTLEELSFVIKNTSAWEIIKGHLSLDDVIIQSKIKQFSPSLQVANALIQGQLNIGNVGLTMKAEKTRPDALWEFGLILENPVTVDFYKMLSDMNVNSQFNISPLVPKSLTIDTFGVKIIPETQYYKIKGHGTLKWDIDLGLTTLKINDLGGELEIKETPVTSALLQERITGLSLADAGTIVTSLVTNKFITADGLPLSTAGSGLLLDDPSHETAVKQVLTDLRNNEVFSASVFGSFDFASIRAKVSLKFGSVENTVLTAELTPAEVSALNASSVATALTIDGSNDANAWNNLPISSTLSDSTFKTGGFSSATVHIDFSNKTFIFYGQSKTFGQAAFLAKKLDKTVALWNFQGIVRTNPSAKQSKTLSTDDSANIWNTLVTNGFINDKGEIQATFNPTADFSLKLGEYEPEASEIIKIIQSIRDGNNWGYFIAVSTPDNGFKFESIDPHLGIIDEYIHVKRASFAVSSFSANSVKDLTKNVTGFDQAITIRKENDSPVAIGRGVNFFAELDFSTDLLGNIIKLRGGNDGTPAVTLYGYLASDVSETILQAQFPDITLLGNIHFTNVNFQYKAANNKELSLCGTITIPIGSGLPFHGALKINDDRADFKMQAGGDVNPCSIGNTLSQPQIVQAPLGMTGIDLRTPQLEVTALYKDKNGNKLSDADVTFRIAGGVCFKNPQGNKVLDVEGEIIFDKGTPVVVSVSLTDSVLNIGNFLNTIFGSNSWTFLDISFIGGYISYAKCPDDAATCTYLGKEYKNGFTARTTVDIYGHKFGIAVTVITTGDEQGITFSGRPDFPIDLEFIKLYGLKDGTNTPDNTIGPSVGVSFLSNQKHFKLDFGLNLFQTDIGSAKLEYSTADSKFLGDVNYTGPLSVGNGVKMKFSWSEKEGFMITDWPLQSTIDKDTLKLADTMRQISKTDGCGELIDLVFHEAINTDFSMSAKQKSDSCTTHDGQKALCFDITGTYSIDILTHKKVVSASLPVITLTIPLPKSFSLSGLATLVKDTIVENATSIVKQFFSDPAKLTAFFAVVSVSEFSGKLLSGLLCRDVKSQNIKSASESKAASEETLGEKKLDEAKQFEETASRAANVVEAASAAAKAGLAADAAVDLFAGVIGLITGLGAANISDYIEKLNAAEQKKKSAEEIKRKAQETIRKKLKLESITINYQRPDTVQISWTAISSGAGIDYDYNILAGNDTVAEQEHYISTSIRITNQRITSHTQLSAKVRARVTGVDNNGNRYEYEGDWTQTHVEILPRPIVTQQYSSQTLTASWPKINNASGYYAEVFVTDKNKVAATKANIIQSNGTEVSVNFMLSDFTVNDGGMYQVRVKAIGGEGFHESEFGQADTFNIRLDAPSGITQDYTKTGETPGLTGSWAMNPQAASYAVKLVNTTSGETISSTTITNDITKTRLQTQFSQAALTSLQPGNLTVQVQAVGIGPIISSGFGISSISTGVLPAPGTVSQQYIKAEKKLSVQWDHVTASGFDHYILEIYDEKQRGGNPPVFTLQVVPVDPEVAAVAQQVDVTSFLSWGEALYRASVKSIGRDVVIDSKQRVSTSATPQLAAPTQVVQVYHADTQDVDVEWNTLTNAQQYLLQINEPASHAIMVTQLIEAHQQQPARQSFTFKKDKFTQPLNGIYQAVVMAVGEDTIIDSEWGLSPAQAIPELQPPDVSLIFKDGNIVAFWEVTDQRITEYILQLFDGNGIKVGNEVSVTDHHATFNPGEGTKYSVKIKVKNGQTESNWSPGTTITIYRLDTPTQFVVNNYRNNLLVTWLGVRDAEQYKIIIQKTDGTPVLTALATNALPQIITSNLIIPGQTYTLQLWAEKGQSFSAVNTISYTVINGATTTLYFPQLSSPSGTYYLANKTLLSSDNNVRDIQAVEVIDLENDAVTAKLSSGAVRTGWFPFVYQITNLSRCSGFESGDRVVIQAFDMLFSYLLIESKQVEGVYSWKLSSFMSAEIDVAHVFTIGKSVSTDRDGKLVLGSGSILADDPVIFLNLLNSNPVLGTSPEGMVWQFQLPPAGRVVKILTPLNVRLNFNSNTEEIIIQWEMTTGSNGYLVDIFRVDTEHVEYSMSDITPIVLKENDLIVILKKSDFTAAPGIFKARVKAKSPDSSRSEKNGSPYDSAFGISTGTITKLDQAMLIDVHADLNTVTGTWSAVNNAAEYIFEIENGSLKRSMKSSTTAGSINVSDLPAGPYHARVRAVGGQNVMAGDWSTALDIDLQPLNEDALAKKMAKEGHSAIETGDSIKAAFPDIDFARFARALAQAPYPPVETARALKKNFPGLSPAQQATTLKAAYRELTAELFARRAFASGKDSVVTAQGLKQHFPSLDYTGFVAAMGKTGYGPAQIAQGFNAVFLPSLREEM
jgi:hypothetical protein